MIKLEKTEVFGWEAAIRGMRNPLNSWDKSDSGYDDPECEDCPCLSEKDYYHPKCQKSDSYLCPVEFIVGENDLALMKKLSKAGTDHSKFLRMINVTVDITAPLYWWKEYDTYKVGTVANSCSTMHKIHEKEFTLDDFSHEHLYLDSKEMLEKIIKGLNAYREDFLRENNKDYWWQLIQMLPTSYNQKRTVQLNYQVLKSIYFARKSHKLDEWREFCKWCESLPYFYEICINI